MKPTLDKTRFDRPDPLLTPEEFCDFMAASGRAPSPRTARRWAREDHMKTRPDPRDRRQYRAPISDWLEAHRRRQRPA